MLDKRKTKKGFLYDCKVQNGKLRLVKSVNLGKGGGKKVDVNGTDVKEKGEGSSGVKETFEGVPGMDVHYPVRDLGQAVVVMSSGQKVCSSIMTSCVDWEN